MSRSFSLLSVVRVLRESESWFELEVRHTFVLISHASTKGNTLLLIHPNSLDPYRLPGMNTSSYRSLHVSSVGILIDFKSIIGDYEVLRGELSLLIFDVREYDPANISSLRYIMPCHLTAYFFTNDMLSRV